MPNLLLHSDNYGKGRDSDLGRDLRCSATPELAARALAEDGYVVVGTFDDDMKPWEIYRHTQNGVVSRSWSRYPTGLVRPVGSGTLSTPRGDMGYRSTSMGDAIVVDGTVYVLGRIDFDEVPAPVPATLRGIDGSEVEVAPAPRP